MFHWCVICCQGFLSLYLLGAVKNRGEIFKFFVKGDLNVFRVALSPDDWTFCDSWCFLLPKHFYFPQLFPGSILLPPVIGVDAPPPIYSGREWWKLTKPPEALILTQNAPQTVWRPGSARSCWGSLQRSARPPSWIKGVSPPGGEGKWEGRGRRGNVSPISTLDVGG